MADRHKGAKILASSKNWPAESVALRAVVGLLPYARNARTHSDKQIAQLVASIKQFGWTIPVLVDEAGGIIAGHGRVLAAVKMGLAEVPCMTARGWSEDQKRAYVLADNQLALQAGWDDGLLRSELSELKAADFNLSALGFSAAEFDALFSERDATYSRKIEAPIYEPRGERPAPASLYDDTKAVRLIEQIRAADLPEDVAAFLEVAAERHVVFDFTRIADFYAHADAPIQRLMEASALVIVDFDQAVEHGFVKLTRRLAELASAQFEGMTAPDTTSIGGTEATRACGHEGAALASSGAGPASGNVEASAALGAAPALGGHVDTTACGAVAAPGPASAGGKGKGGRKGGKAAARPAASSDGASDPIGMKEAAALLAGSGAASA